MGGIAVTNLENSPILQADEAGSVTLPVYSGDQTLTPVLYIILYIMLPSVVDDEKLEQKQFVANFCFVSAGKYTRNRRNFKSTVF